LNTLGYSCKGMLCGATSVKPDQRI